MQTDQSLWPPLHCRGRIPRFLQAPQNFACVLVERGARFGELRAARGAMKQADTKILFKAGDRARDGRCPGIRGNCSFRKAADLYRSHEHTQRAQIVHFWRLRIALATKTSSPLLRLSVFRRGLRSISTGTAADKRPKSEVKALWLSAKPQGSITRSDRHDFRLVPGEFFDGRLAYVQVLGNHRRRRSGNPVGQG